jgi:hypothetical protein
MRFTAQSVTSYLAALLIVGLVGCTGRSSLPSTAHLEQEGTNGLSFTAPSSGTVYVLDANDNKKVFGGKMSTGNQLVVRPSLGLIVLDGNNVSLTDTLPVDHKYQIFFDPGH